MEKEASESGPRDFRSFIGAESSVHFESLTAGSREQFARSIGASSGSAVPTYWTRCRAGEFELLSRMGIELKQVLHADQEYRFHAPAPQEGRVKFRTRVAQVLEKASRTASLHFFTFETAILPEAGNEEAPIVEAISTIVYRELLEPEAVSAHG